MFSISIHRFHSVSSAPTVTRLPLRTMELTSAEGSLRSSERMRLSVDMCATGRSSAFFPERSTNALALAEAGKKLQLPAPQPVLFEVHQLIGNPAFLEKPFGLEHIGILFGGIDLHVHAPSPFRLRTRRTSAPTKPTRRQLSRSSRREVTRSV